MPIDPATGVYLFTGSEPDTPMHTTLNLLATSTRDAMAARQAEMAALEQNSRQSYRRFTLTRNAMADNQYYFMAMTGEVTADASPNPFPYTYDTTPAALNGSFLLPAGVYSFDLFATFSANTSGRSTVDMWSGLANGDASTGGTLLRRGGWGGIGEFTASMVVNRYRFKTPARIWFRTYKQTGGSATITADLGVTRHEGL